MSKKPGIHSMPMLETDAKKYEEVALINLEKLKLRASKGKISGSGDDR